MKQNYFSLVLILTVSFLSAQEEDFVAKGKKVYEGVVWSVTVFQAKGMVL